jgi:uncharacterized membrane protein
MAQTVPQAPPRRHPWLWPLVLALSAVIMGLPSLDEPFGRDEGTYAAFAAILRRGGLPYVNAWDHKPPGIYYTYAAIFDLLGRSMIAVRLFDIFFTLALMAAIYALAARAFDRTTGKAAAFLIAFVYLCDVKYDSRAEADSMMMLPLTLAALFLVRAGPGPRRLAWVAATGFMATVCIWFKVTSAVTVLAFGLFLLIEDLLIRRRLARIACEAAVYLLGVAAAVAPVLLYAWKAGFLNAMIEIVVKFNSQYYAASAHAAGGALGMAKSILQTTGWWPYLIFPATVAGLAALIRRRRDELVVLVFAASCAGAVLMQGKLWLYQWMVVFPAWSVMAAATYVEAARRMSWRSLSPVVDNRNLLLAMVMCALAVYALADWADNASESIAYHTGRISAARFYGGELKPGLYEERFGRYRSGDFSYWADLQVAAYLQQHTSPEDRVYIWGFEPLIYFLADRQSASRFLMDHPLNASFALRDAWRRELVDTLERQPPLYFIVVRNDLFELQSVDSATQLLHFPALLDFVRRHYRPEAEIEDFTLWRRTER